MAELGDALVAAGEADDGVPAPRPRRAGQQPRRLSFRRARADARGGLTHGVGGVGADVAVARDLLGAQMRAQAAQIGADIFTTGAQAAVVVGEALAGELRREEGATGVPRLDDE